jgi:pimeloyl-ACP methyl ester carboxylesterase
MKFTLSLACLLILVGCSMDKFFLQPTTISKSITKFKIHTEQNDSSYIVAVDTSKNYQPTFFSLNQSLINTDYNLKSVIIKSENGNKLNGWWLISDSINPKGTIIFFHGNSGSLFSQSQFIQPFITKNYNIFIFDYSGFGYSTGKAKQKNALTDGISVIKYISKEINDKNNNIFIYGQSYGGQLAIAS